MIWPFRSSPRTHREGPRRGSRRHRGSDALDHANPERALHRPGHCRGRTPYDLLRAPACDAKLDRGSRGRGYHYDVAATMEIELESNWKCALEAFQETYHFPYVHGNSVVGQGTIANIVTFDQIGRHHRLGVPIVSMGTDPDPPEGEHLVCIYYIYPCSVIATSPLGGEMLQFYPDRTRPAARSATPSCPASPSPTKRSPRSLRPTRPRSKPSSATKTAQC